MTLLPRLLAAFALAVGGATGPSAQDTPPPSAPAPTAPAPAELTLADLVPQAAALAGRRARLAERLAALGDLAQPETALVTAEANLGELQDRLDGLGTSDAAGFEPVAAVKAAGQLAVETLQGVLAVARTRLAELEAAKLEWGAEANRWRRGQAAFRGEAAARAAAPAVTGAREAIAEALELLEGTAIPLVELQRRATEAAARAQEVVTAAEALLQAMKGDLLRRARPSMLSPAFYAQFHRGLWDELRAGIEGTTPPPLSFLASQGWVIALQLAAALGLGTAIRRHARHLEGAERWQFLLRRPFSAGFLLGVAVFTPLYAPPVPAVWRLALWTAAGLGAARLAADVVALPWRRRLVYLLAALFLVSQALALVSFPTPLFRLYVAAVGLGGAALCHWRAQENRQRTGASLYAWALHGGSVVLLAVFLAQVGGYTALATHLLDASIKTTFLGLFAWMVALLANGAVEFALGTSAAQANAIVRKHRRLLQARAAAVANGAVGVLALAAVLEVWRLYDTPTHALRSLLGLGITVGEVRVSVGLVLTAGAVLAGALATSWLVQRVLDEEVYPRRGVEPGVGLSINRLIQYGFTLAGFLAAVSALGIELQNLTILAGAFGIGIGFGLQTIVNNFVSGLILLFERPLKVGDLVQLGDQWGTVRKLGLRATVVQTVDQSEIIVPNSDLVAQPVTNWTLSDRHARLTITVGVAYGSDVPRTMELLAEVARAHPLVLQEPAPQVFFMAFGASSLDFELRTWLADIDKRFPVRSDLHREIDRRFREAGIEIAFPQRDLHLRTVDDGARRALAAALGTGKDA